MGGKAAPVRRGAGPTHPCQSKKEGNYKPWSNRISQYASTATAALSRRQDYLRADRREQSHPVPARQTDNIKGTSGTLGSCPTHGNVQSAVAPQNAVSQGKREILRAWPGQSRQLLSPSVGIADSARNGLHIPVSGRSHQSDGCQWVLAATTVNTTQYEH